MLSSDDPVRVFQEFSTIDLLSGGRAEIMAGRGSFIESFPLFGYNLEDYDQLFEEKLDLLLALRDGEMINELVVPPEPPPFPLPPSLTPPAPAKAMMGFVDCSHAARAPQSTSRESIRRMSSPPVLTAGSPS